MPFYFRKSVSAGPFRFNFSKSGVGASVGAKGLRVGTGPKGHYIHAGRGGVYYRATLGRAGEKRSIPVQAPLADKPLVFIADGVEMVEVESGAVEAMRDEGFGDLLDQLNGLKQQIRMSAILGWTAGVGGLLVCLAAGLSVIVAGVLAAIAWAFGRWIDSYRRTAVLFYELEPDVQQAYERLTSTFDTLAACAAKWHVEAGGAVRDLTTWKRNAGASHLVSKKPIAPSYKLPSVVTSNVTPPALPVGKQTLYFMPDVLLIEHGSSFGAVSYKDLRVSWQLSNFIEEGSVPTDAVVIGQTWQHPNKNGGPDRRFASNRQIPICRYEVMHLSSSTGLNELVEFSRTEIASDFAGALNRMPQQRTEHLATRFLEQSATHAN